MANNTAYGFGTFGYGNQPYQIGFGMNSLAPNIYYHTGQLVDSVVQDAQTIWDREDSAYQRMVSDMQKAGLNPWTGVSSGGSPTSSNNPSMEGLTSLLNVLNGTLATDNAYTRDSKRLYDTVIDLLTMGLSRLF